jgi:hypothetical protein
MHIGPGAPIRSLCARRWPGSADESARHICADLRCRSRRDAFTSRYTGIRPLHQIPTAGNWASALILARALGAGDTANIGSTIHGDEMSQVGKQGISDSPAAPSDTLHVLAYNAAVDVLKQQDGTLSSTRNRASGLLATAVLAASFSTSVGLLGTGLTGNKPIAHQYAWVLLATVISIGIVSSIVAWPVHRWGYGPDPKRLLDAIEKEHLIAGQLYRDFTILLVQASIRNHRQITYRVRCYQAGILLLIVEVGTIILAIIMK